MTDAPRMLLIDDDETFTRVMSRGLRRHGFEVKSAHSANDGLATARVQQPSHILLDLNMPGGSGLTVLPQLLAAVPGVKLMVLTGYSSIATAVQATKAGACNYLCKPAGIEEILRGFEESAVPVEVDETQPPPSVERVEWEHIQRVLNDNDGNVSATARALGMHRRTLQRKLQKRPVRQ